MTIGALDMVGHVQVSEVLEHMGSNDVLPPIYITYIIKKFTNPIPSSFIDGGGIKRGSVSIPFCQIILDLVFQKSSSHFKRVS